MSPVKLFAELGPYARVGVAVGPFVVACALRLLFGRTRLTGHLISITTIWFTVNVLIAPYSLQMQRELHRILH
jgi:hypothetical protein